MIVAGGRFPRRVLTRQRSRGFAYARGVSDSMPRSRVALTGGAPRT